MKNAEDSCVILKVCVFILVEDPYIYTINCSSPGVKEKGGGGLPQVAKCTRSIEELMSEMPVQVQSATCPIPLFSYAFN